MKVHFLGIGGSGSSAIAAIAQSQGFEITGCDLEIENEFTSVFSQEQLKKGHSPVHLEGVNILAVTPAIFSLDPNNPELMAAKEKGVPILTWQQFMGEYLEKNKFVIAVCGTHGKSTTTAMAGLLLEEAGMDPTVELGAIAPKWGKNYRIGKGGYFITEADEFNDNYLASTPDITIVTTIEMDHPEYFNNFLAVKRSFLKFLSKTKKLIIANLSDKGIRETLEQDVVLRGKIVDYSQALINFPLQIPGEFNKLNASAVYQLGLALRIDYSIVKKSLSSFTGAARRFEYLGKFKNSQVYSDFGHHPTEIDVTLKAAREKFPNEKIVVIFQPHMFSRTKALFGDFVKVLKELPVDKIYILPIYPSRELDSGLVNSEGLVSAINKPTVFYCPEDNILDQLKEEEADILFFLGAGNTDKLARQLLS